MTLCGPALLVTCRSMRLPRALLLLQQGTEPGPKLRAEVLGFLAERLAKCVTSHA